MRPIIAIPALIAIIFRAYSRNSLTTPGLIVAALTASIHALHPSSLPFTLLGVFFLLGTTATKVKHEIKATLTLSSTGDTGGEGPRTTVQVLANSGVALVLCLLQVLKYGPGTKPEFGFCFGNGGARDLIMCGIIANYAAVTADTLSSELGILSKSRPRLITTLKTVPPGTNGGITLAGVIAGAAGSAVIGLVSVLLLNFCDATNTLHIWRELTMIGYRDSTLWNSSEKIGLWLAVTICGTLGSLLDSWLGAVLQASVIDRRTGKVVEGAGGKKVLVQGQLSSVEADRKSEKQVSRSIGSGRDILSNNQVNLLMAATMSIVGVVGGSIFMGIELGSIFS